MNQKTAASVPGLELTPLSIFLGILLSIVMGAANVYLGLKAGMTVSASIPAAVIAMGILRLVFRRTSILEANLVQTAASAGESLAAGVIFTMPALIIVGIWSSFDFWTTSMICLTGGLLGILFMIPMRKVFIVDSKELKFPEGIACAELLKAGSESGEESVSDLKLLFGAVGVGAFFEFSKKFLGLISSSVELAGYYAQRIFVFGFDVSPALIGVGFIVGIEVAMQVFAGGCIGWIIGIPLLGTSGTDVPAIDQAYELWSTQIRYIGVGAMIVGGAHSIFTIRGGIADAVKEMGRQFKAKATDAVLETERNLSGKTIITVSALTVLGVFGTYYQLLDKSMSISLLTTAIMLVAAFFFTAVASYIVGLVGNSNSPVSGMTITVVLLTGLLLYIMDFKGEEGILAVLGVAGVVCCVCCTSGDVCNDLKTGHLIGASPRKQQMMQILGVGVAAFVMAPVMIALHEGSINSGTGGIGGETLPAPQAGLFASLAEGFFGNAQLPWTMIAIGAGIGVSILILNMVSQAKRWGIGFYVMPVAVGIYLPIGLSVPIMLGGLVHWLITRKSKERSVVKRGVLISSGLIAGESLLGVGLAVFAYYGILGLGLDEKIGHTLVEILGTLSVLGICAWLYMTSKPKA